MTTFLSTNNKMTCYCEKISPLARKESARETKMHCAALVGACRLANTNGLYLKITSIIPPATMISLNHRHLSLVTLLIWLAVIFIHETTLVSTSDHRLSHAEIENRHCSPDACDSIVTKCKKTKRCTCNVRRPECAKKCLDCLEEKFGKCCGCVDLCPVHKDDYSQSSHVGDLNDTSYDQLFDVLTETDDIYGRWSIMTLPAFKEIHHPEFGLMHMRVDKNGKVVAQAPQLTTTSPDVSKYEDEEYQRGREESGAQKHEVGRDDNDRYSDSDDDEKFRGTKRQEDLGCVVAFINKQLSMSQCRKYCRSMGASSFRWFHDEGCCECVGKSCYLYGVAEPKCSIRWD